MKRPKDAVASLQRALKCNPADWFALSMFPDALAAAGGLENLDYSPPPDCQIPALAEVYREVFGYRTHGRFLEIGAFDGESYSNTSFLADIGWTGIYVEPIPRYADACRNRHKLNDVQVLQYAVGGMDGEAKLEIRGVLSSFSESYNTALKQDFGAVAEQTRTLVVPMKTLQSLVEDIRWEKADILVIDVEGYEWPIISNFDFSSFKPTMIILEVHDQEEYPIIDIRNQSRMCIQKLSSLGYHIHWRDEGNVIFLS